MCIREKLDCSSCGQQSLRQTLGSLSGISLVQVKNRLIRNELSNGGTCFGVMYLNIFNKLIRSQRTFFILEMSK